MGIYSTTTRYTGTSGIDVESMVSVMMQAESVKYNKLTQQRQMLVWKQQSYQDVSTSLKEFQSTYLNMSNMATNMRSASLYSGLTVSAKVGGTDSDAVKATVTSKSQAGTYRLNISQLAQAESWTSEVGSSTVDLTQSMAETFTDMDITKTSFTVNGTDISFKPSGTIQEFMDAVNNSGAGVKMSYDTLYNRFVFEGDETGAENALSLGSSSTTFLNSLGLSKKNEAQDAKFSVNGNEELTRSTNTFDMYGITITLNETTETGKPVVITAEKDATATMSLIKDFVSAYNTMLDSLSSLYTTNRSKLNGSNYNYYEPLSDDEKANMTENEIKLWEDETKKGLLYRDSIIGGLLSDMRSMMYESVELPSGGKISLYEIGITTGSYSNGGKLYIDEDKLKTALTERTDDVATLFTKSSTISTSNTKSRLKDEGLAERLNDLINNAVSTNGSIGKKAGFGSSDTGAEINKQLTRMDTQLSTMLDALTRKEESLYKKFSVMESTITSYNSQLSTLLSMLGSE